MSSTYVITNTTGAGTFAITDTKRFIPVLTLSINDDAKLMMQELKSGFKRIISRNKYQLKVTIERRNQYLDYSVNPSFQGVNRRFVLSFYTTGCLLDFPYFRKYYKIIAIDLSKQQALDADPKAIQQITFTGNLDWARGPAVFLIIKGLKETILDFSQGIVRVL